MRILFIIGLIFTTLFLIFIFIAATSNGRIDIDEFAAPSFCYGLFMMAITIIGMIKWGKQKNV